MRASYAVGTGPQHADIEGFAMRVLRSGRLHPADPLTQPWPAVRTVVGAPERHRVGSLTVAWDHPADAPERFDPVDHPLPGTSQYPAVARLPEPAYRLARVAWPRAGRLPRRAPAVGAAGATSGRPPLDRR